MIISNTLKNPVSPAMQKFGSTLSVNSGVLKPIAQTTPLGPVKSLSQPTSSPVSGIISPIKQATSPNPSSLMQQAQGIQNSLNSSISSGQISGVSNPPSAPKVSVQPDPNTYKGYINRIAGASNPTGTQTGIIKSIQQTAQGNQAIGQQAQQIANQYGTEINRVGQLGAGAVAGDLSTGSNVVGSGNANLASQAVSSRIQALQNAESAQLQGTAQQLTAQGQTASAYNQAGGLANTQQGQQISGLGTAAGYAQPIQLPYNNQYVDPTTGQPIGGGQAGQLPSSAQNAVNTYAQQVQNGQMTRADAEQRLAPYGVAGTNALTQALGPNFNTNASNASAGTTAVGQQVQTAANSTNQALDTLSTLFGSLSGLETGGWPVTNSIAQWIGEKMGDSKLTQYKTNLADARSQLIGVLNSSGGTPTGNESTANQYLPDNMTVEQFKQNVGTAQNPGIVRQLIAQKVGSFTGSGNQNQNSGNNQVQYNPDGSLQAVSF